MKQYRSFEEMKVWRDSRQVVKSVYHQSKEGRLSKEYVLSGQMKRSALSVMSNIAEGFERDGNKEFLQYLSIAKASAGELRSQLYVAFDAGFMDVEIHNTLMDLILEISRQLSGMIRYIQRSSYAGHKHYNKKKVTG